MTFDTADDGERTGEELVRLLELGVDLEASALPDDVDDFLRQLGGPTLIRVRGNDSSRTRVVSTLLHGNEPSGIRAVHTWLCESRRPSVDVLIFIAAVETARMPPGFAHRFLPGRVDMNRCWLPPFEGWEGRVAHEVLRLVRQSGAESLVDLHNNTGHNPPYGVGTLPGAAELNLVSLFGKRYVHSPLRLGTLVEATCEDFPSVTIECGRSGDPGVDAVALDGLREYVGCEQLELRRVVAEDITLLIDPVRVSVAPGVELAFGDDRVEGADLTVALDIDRHNFERVAAGSAIGWLGPRGLWPVEALGETNRDVSRELFELRDGELVTRNALIPIMMTTNRENALTDCLFYVVQKGKPPAPPVRRS